MADFKAWSHGVRKADYIHFESWHLFQKLINNSWAGKNTKKIISLSNLYMWEIHLISIKFKAPAKRGYKLMQVDASCKSRLRLPANSHQLASTCINLHQLASTCINLHQLASTCINLHQLWAVSNWFWCKSTRVFARLTGHESCCMRVVDKFRTASGFYFVATGSTKLLSVFLVNFRSTLIDSHATLVLVWPSNHASSCKLLFANLHQLASSFDRGLTLIFLTYTTYSVLKFTVSAI